MMNAQIDKQMSEQTMDMPMETGLAAGFPLGAQQRALYSSAGAMAPAAVLQVAIDGDLERAVLQAALNRLRARHQVLACRFVAVDGYRGMRQLVVTPTPPVTLDYADLSLHDERADTALVSYLEQYRDPAFDLGAGDTMRAALLRTGERQWQLLLAFSPLVADRHSLAVISEELRVACTGADPALDEPFQFEQFVAWRQELNDGEDAATGEAYWAGQLTSMPEARPAGLSFRAASPAHAPAARAEWTQDMPAELAANLARFALQRERDVESVLHAGWLALLARLTADSDQPVQLAGGWQHDCRRDYEALAGAVGPIGQVLPLHLAVDPAWSFDAVLAALADVCNAHREQQEYWQPDGADAAPAPAIGFVFGAAPPARAGALQWQVQQLPGPSACFELALLADQTRLSLHYDSTIYSAAAIAQLLDQYVTLLSSALADPAQAIDRLAVLGDAARARLLALNSPPAPIVAASDGDASVPAWIAHWRAHTPDAPALAEGDTRLTYAQLDARVGRLAGALVAHGAAPGTVVALRLPRSLDLVVALLAVWRAGAAYLPVEPDWPPARQAAIALDAEPVLMLGTAATGPVPPGLACPYLLLPDLAAAGADHCDTGMSDRPAGTGHAYILYTSGSTGTPKGVAIGHAQLANYVAAARQAMALDQCRNWGLTSTVAADLGNTALFCALASGACLSVATAHDMRDGAGFARFMRHHGIDALKMVPSHLEALIDGDDPALPRTLVLGGEAASPALLQKLQQHGPASRVFNHYGPTESTVGVMVHAVDPARPPTVGGLPLSRVLANCRVFVLDRHLQLAPPGASGELYIGGAQLCHGYLKQTVATAFVADPFLPGATLYRSGDRACYLPEGGLRLMGRLDRQVKIRGFRIEPAEIEAVMARQEGVRQALVLARDGARGTELVACVEFDAGRDAAASVAALREALVQCLPAAMQPAAVIAVAQMPRLGNGKIDRRALATLVAQTAQSGSGAGVRLTPPRDALESVLAENMAQLLNLDAIGADQDFFDAGGHSLLAIKLVARVGKLFRIEIAPALVFDHPTAIALGQALRALAHDPAQLDRLAELRQQLAAMSPQERAALERAAEHANAPSNA